MALTKADFAAQLLNELGLSKSMAKNLVELFFETFLNWITPKICMLPGNWILFRYKSFIKIFSAGC